MDARATAPARRTIVIIDDSAALLHALTFALEAEGFDVLTFRSAARAFEGAAVDQAACLIIDQKLPDEPGLDLLERLRTRGNRVPAVLITTHPPPAVLDQAARLHAPVVEKPLLGDSLFAQVRAMMTRAQEA